MRCRRVVEYNERQFDKPLPGGKAEELYWNGKQAARCAVTCAGCRVTTHQAYE
jgi:hypothetical protein